jgi:type IV pilus assembly protein PilW
VKTYFIGQNPVGGDSLYVIENQNAPSELVPDITDLQLSFGQDGNGDGSVDSFGDASVVTMSEVVSVRIEITAASAKPQASGNRLSRVYTKTSNIRNRSL